MVEIQYNATAIRVYWWYMLSIVVALVIHKYTVLEDKVHRQSEYSPYPNAHCETAASKEQIHYPVILGVLSHRSHFKERDIIRNGLLKRQGQNNFTWKFLVARRPCSVPYEERRDIYECDPYAFVSPSSDKHYFQSHHGSEVPGTLFVPPGPVGFDFVTNDNISVGHLGVYDHRSDGFRRNLKVTLYETYTRKIILSRTFLPFGVRGSLIHKTHVYKDGEAMILPKGFHGSIVIEGFSSQDPLLKTEDCYIDDGGGLITYHPGYRFGYKEGGFPAFLKHVDSLCPFLGPSLIYSFHGSAGYNVSQRSKRYDDLQQSNVEDQELLEVEQAVHKDILFIDAVEYYRNLPLKMLGFYQWLSGQLFDFAMKTDDDCYINIEAISAYVNNELLHRHRVWVGNFRTNWQVNMVGKWQDQEYSSFTYPPFPCGSGYLVSRDLVKWIAMNREYLKCYQGEDVSLGIWLAAVHPIQVQEARFLCTAADVSSGELFSVPDKAISELEVLYGNIGKG